MNLHLLLLVATEVSLVRSPYTTPTAIIQHPISHTRGKKRAKRKNKQGAEREEFRLKK